MEHAKRHIPNRLKKHRVLMGYKQKDVAYLLGLVSTNRISQWEHGLTLPNTTNLIKLSVIYRTLPTDLYYDLMNTIRQELSTKEQTLLVQTD